jgi:hypothetical protein
VEIMIIAVSYEKDLDGDIEVILEVIDKGDFPTDNIFNESENYPSDREYELKEQQRNFDTRFCKTAAGAQKWARLQIMCIESMLNKWREICVPTPERHEI